MPSLVAQWSELRHARAGLVRGAAHGRPPARLAGWELLLESLGHRLLRSAVGALGEVTIGVAAQEAAEIGGRYLGFGQEGGSATLANRCALVGVGGDQ